MLERRAQVFLVDFDGDRKTVFTPDATFHARALVLATGAMGRKPSFEGEGELRTCTLEGPTPRRAASNRAFVAPLVWIVGKGVSYCATCDGAFYCDCEIAVVGGSQEAIEEAVFLTKFASTVHRLDPRSTSHGYVAP